MLQLYCLIRVTSSPSYEPDEEHLTLLRAFDALSQGIAILDRETGTLVANDAYRRALASSVGSDCAPGSEPALEIFASDRQSLSPEQWPGARALRGDFVEHLELTIRRGDTGKEFVAEFSTRPLYSESGRVQCVVSFHDVTDRRAQSAEIQRLTRLYATLSEVNQIIVRCASRAELFTEICRIGISFGKFGGVAIAWKSAADAAFVPVASAMETPGLDLPGWTGCCETCLEGLSSGHPAICNETCADSAGSGCHAALAECGYRSCGAYPLLLNGTVRGALMLCSREPGFFSGPEARLLREVASDVSFALDKLHRESERQRMLELIAEGGRLAKLGTWERNFSAGTAIWSREMYRLWGRDPALGPIAFPDLSNHFTAESWPRLRTLVEATRETGTPFVCDAQLISAKGDRLWLICHGEPLLDEEGRRVGVRGSIQDVTERKRAEIALAERETQVRLYAEHCPAAVAMLDEGLRYLVVSRRWVEQFKLEGTPVIGRTPYEVIPDIPERWKAVHQRCLAGAIERCDADPVVRSDGSTSWIRWEVRPWRRADESIGGIMVCSEDITAMKRQIESTNLFRALIEHSTDGIYVADPATAQFLDVNASACASLGYTREELIGRPVFAVVQGLTPEFYAEMNVQLRAEGHISVEIPHLRKDGTAFLGEANLSLVTLDRDYLLVVVRDVTAHRQAERDLRTRSAFLEAMVESAHGAVLVVDEHLRILLKNGDFIRMFRVPPALAEAADDTLMLRHVAAQAKNPEPFIARVTELFAHRGEVAREEIELADGRILERYSAPVLDASTHYFGRIWSFRDITEERRLEHQALRSQRLEAIGTLSNGIAHDLNNILTPVLMAAGLLGAEARTPRHAELLQLIESESQRARRSFNSC